MQRTLPLQNSTTEEESGTRLAAEDYFPQALRQSNGDAIPLPQHRPARFGLPCANCKAYYAPDVPACPICKCAERVSAEEAGAKSWVSTTVSASKATTESRTLRFHCFLASPAVPGLMRWSRKDMATELPLSPS
jgi:hypothetical protein